MVQSSYLGPAASATNDLSRKVYLDNLKGTGFLTQAQVDSLISTGLAPYATKVYVDGRDALKASVAAVDAVDDTKLKVSSINTSGGPVGLDSSGRVPVGRVPGTSTQRFPMGPYTPLSFLGSLAMSVGGGEVTLMTSTVTDPGFTYRLLISGQIDCHTNVSGDPPVVRVRANSTSGQLLAAGIGSTRQYRWGVDTFDRTATNLGVNWQQVYTNTGYGAMVTNGTSAVWSPNGGLDNTGFFRRINSFATTSDDYQEVWTKVASVPQSPGLFGELFSGPPYNRIYGRVNADRTSWTAYEMTSTTASLIYANGTSTGVLVKPVPWDWAVGDEIVAQFGYYPSTAKRRYRLIRNGVIVIDFTESSTATAMSAAHRGWGFGVKAPATLIAGQVLPAGFQWIAYNDPAAAWSADPENYSPVTLVPFTATETFTGATTLYVTLRAQGTSTVYASTSYPKLHVVAIPA